MYETKFNIVRKLDSKATTNRALTILESSSGSHVKGYGVVKFYLHVECS